jgi:pSer/pThr/pTyr-binding forkhead associated (FHA) protein
MLHCEEGVHSGGRNERCDLVLDHPTISGWHFELTVSRDGVFVRDLGSRNGTRVKGEGVATEPVELHDDDVVLLSREVSLRVARGAAARKAA